MILPLVFVVDSKNCEFVPRGSNCWLLSHESMPNFIFFVVENYVLRHFLCCGKLCIMAKETMILSPIASLSSGP